jgi:hypothetical protein
MFRRMDHEFDSVTEAITANMSPDAAAATVIAYCSEAGAGTPTCGGPSDASARPPRGLAPGTTHGTIACGWTRCRAGSEACVFTADSWRCIGVEPVYHADRIFECDDTSDCLHDGPSGSADADVACCTFGVHDENARCLPRAFASGNQCELEVCSQDEGASPCPAGQSCIEGHCRSTSPARATCAGGERCPVEAPVCHWQEAAGTCITNGQSDALRARFLDPTAQDRPSVFACTKPSDCGVGQTCCNNVNRLGGWGLDSSDLLVTECRNACETIWYQDICNQSSDCPRSVGSKPERCSKAPNPSRPPWIGKCEM